MSTADPCPWCGEPVPLGTRNTRDLKVGGRTVGRLCPGCTVQADDLEADAADGAQSYSPWG